MKGSDPAENLGFRPRRVPLRRTHGMRPFSFTCTFNGVPNLEVQPSLQRLASPAL